MASSEYNAEPAAGRTPGVEPLPSGENEFRLIADSAPVPIWVTRLDRTRSFVNRAYLDFLGVDYPAALVFDWRAIIHPDDQDRIVEESIAGEAGLQTFTLEGRYRRGDGSWRWLRSVSQPRRDARGRHIGFIGVAHDVTEAKEAELALREREAQLSAFVNQATAGFAQTDLSGRFTLVNDRFCAISGWTRAELLDRTMQSITHPDDLGRNQKLFDRAIRERVPFVLEKRYVRSDGEIVWVNNSVAILRREDGEPFGTLAVTIDVTDRRANEIALRKSEESIRLAVECAGMATWELDLASMSGVWSANRFDLLGLERHPAGEGSVDDWLARVHPDDREAVRAAAFGCFDDSSPFTIEYRIHRADTGEERWLQSHGSCIEQGEERARRFVGVSFDVTTRKRAEQELRASEARFRTIFEQANDYLITCDLDHRITSVNPALLAALGYAEDQLVGRSIGDFMDADQFAQSREMLRRKLIEGGTTRHTIRVRSSDGRELVWEVNSQLTFDEEDGTITGLHAIARDVTEAKRFEAHQRLLIDELNHRVKNTLAIVQGIAQQTFRIEEDMAAARAAFEGRLAALSEAHNLLTREHWSPVSMARIISDAVAPHGGGEGRFLLDGPDLALAPKTAISLALAVHELATNAVKHGALSVAEGAVTIRWSRDTDRLLLEWTERGGPPVRHPERRGFGTRMIERGLAAELGGSVTIHFDPEGLRCTVEAPIPSAAA
ncbi:PAS domain-containing sensor histidine kinase [Sphingosinithalassobacter sp. LHW66-3]|uniref:PAS domain-containing sensor histidine kinase n=1 Tax=Sphingosinithalassobacter sp. LHW66-3 TaxID=3424718 RepID=UPI003D6BEE24